MLIKFGTVRLAHVSLAFAGLMWGFPNLNPFHSSPIPSFYQEWDAAILGLLAMPLLATRCYWKQPEIPRIVLLPIGLSLLVLLQFAVGKVTYLGEALLFTLYMLWAALLIMLGHRLREELGLPVLSTVLAVFLLIGAELNALAGVLQHYRWHTFFETVVMDKMTPAVYGNIGQANQFADYITLGLVSLGLLHFRWRLRVWQVALLAAPLLFVLTLSGSRSAGLYLLCMAGMTFLWWRDKTCLPLPTSCGANFTESSVSTSRSLAPLYGSLLLLLGFGLMHFVVQLPGLAGFFGSSVSSGVTPGGRLISGMTGGGSIRLQLWHGAWLIFMQFPLLGAGFGQLAWQYFQLGPVLHNINSDTNNVNIYAHNLVLQVAAEMGLAGLFILLGALLLWLRQAHAVQRTIYHWWGYSLLAVLAIHSMLEYPLWYTEFLGVAALTLGIFDSTIYRPKLNGAGRLSVVAILLLGAVSLQQIWQSYREVERLNNSAPSVFATDGYYSKPMFLRRIHAKLVALHERGGQTLLLQPYIEGFLGEVGWDHIADKGALNERAMRYTPSSTAVYRQALLLARFGRQAEARAQMERAIWAYPEDFPIAIGELRALAGTDTDPARFSGLLEFALQKYEERQRVVHAKP